MYQELVTALRELISLFSNEVLLLGFPWDFLHNTIALHVFTNSTVFKRISQLLYKSVIDILPEL